jgi:PhzF family phenazine biosynthesis protein
LEADLLAKITRGLGLEPDDVKASQWADNGPGWAAIMLGSRKQLLALRPDATLLADMKIGVVAPWTPNEDGTEAQFEVRAFVSSMGLYEDPVTGSLNAGLAQWLIGGGLAPPSYVASQGTALGRKGRVHVQQLGNDIWIGGETATRIEGTVTF